MRKGTRGVLSALIVLIFAGFVFFLGYASIRVPVGKYGIMSSKTGGVYPEVIENGNFCWRWELVIPKNAEIFIFTPASHHFSRSFNGALPSAEIYSRLVQGNPDFSYSFDFDIYLSVNKENLAALASANSLKSDDDLDSYLSGVSEKIARDISQKIIEMNENTVIASYNVPEILSSLDLGSKYKPVEISDVFVKKASVPDLALYNLAKSSYQKFQAEVDASLSDYAKAHAETIIDDEKSVKKLEKIGEVLQKYPELNTILSNGSSADVLKALSELN